LLENDASLSKSCIHSIAWKPLSMHKGVKEKRSERGSVNYSSSLALL